jgi:hypothetical protein
MWTLIVTIYMNINIQMTVYDYNYDYATCSHFQRHEVKAHYSDPHRGVTLYYFPRMCMFECIPPQTFEIFSQYFCILC